MNTKTDIEFVDGLIVKAPRQGAPEYVLANLSIKRAELIAWLQSRGDEWINVECKVAKSGKAYAAVDNWKPSSERQDDKPKGDYRPQGYTGNGGGGRSRSAPIAQTRGNDPFPDDDIPFVTSSSMF